MKPNHCLLVLMLVLPLFSIAQDTLFMYHSGVLVAKRATADIDSIIFYNPEKLPDPEENLYRYFLVGNSGDVIALDVNKDEKTISFSNEKNSNKGSVAYHSTTDPELSGIDVLSFDGKTKYAIQTDEKLMVSHYPFGNVQNSLCIGVSTDVDLNGTAVKNAYLGRYVWISLSNAHVSEWGGMELKSNGTYTWQVGPDDPEVFNPATHFAGGGSGTWSVSSVDPSRLVYNEGGITKLGSVYPGEMLVIEDLERLSIAFKYPDAPVSQSTISGKYLWLDYTPEGYYGAGYYNMPAQGTMQTYYYSYVNNPYMGSGYQILYDLNRSAGLNNLFYTSTVDDGETVITAFFFSPGGKALVATSWLEDGDVVSYAFGLKVNQ